MARRSSSGNSEVTLQRPADMISSRPARKGMALEPIYPHTDRDARHRHEHRTTRQRLLRNLSLIASGNRGLRRARPRAERLFRRLHPGGVSLRQRHRTDRSHSCLRRICRLGRRRHCHHAAPHRIARLGDPARDRWLRLCRDFRHHRELADRKGPTIRAWTSFLDLYGRCFPRSRAGPDLDSSRGSQVGGIVQCDRRTVRCGTGHSYHGPRRAAPSARRGCDCPMVCSREPHLSL